VSSVPAHPTPDPAATERRAHQRRRLDQLAYIGFGPDTGGVLLDISEEGLRCQIVGAVVEGNQCRLKFALPGRHSAIEADGQVVWSNRSRQGGGVRLVGLGSDARQELRQWIIEEASSNGVRKPPAPRPAKSVGAVHVPQPAAPEFVVPEPVANLSVAQLAVDSPPVQVELRTAAEASQSPQPALEVETPAASQTSVAEEPASAPGEMLPALEDAPAVAGAAIARAAQSSDTIAKPAPRVAMQTLVAQPAKRHRAASLVAERRLPVFTADLERRKPRSAKAALLAAGIAMGFAAVMFSGFSPASLFLTGRNPADIVAPVVSVPGPPSDMAATISQTTPGQPSADAKPAMASNAADHPSQNVSQKAAQTSHSDAGIAATAPANRPIQDPTNTGTENRPPLALVLPRPRVTTPAAPAVAVPEASVAPSLPAPLIDMPMLESRAPELPQPAGPPAASGYLPPQVLSSVQPVYSAYARQARLQGTVRVNATIGADGIPHSLVCVSGNTALCQMAFEAIARWRYQPAMSNGRPIEAQTLFSFNFQLR
jgi:protein TonB